MLQERITISLSGKAAEQFRELAERECLPMTALAKQIILKYLANLNKTEEEYCNGTIQQG